MQFQYRQIIHALPQHWKETIKKFAGNLNNLYIQDHYLIKCNTIYNLEILNSRELYHMQYLLKNHKPTCHDYHGNNFEGYVFNQKLIYRIPRIATFESKIRIFQYKIFNNVLYLNKKLFHFGITSQSKCSFCELYDETPLHIFYECTFAQNLWNQLRLYHSEKVALPVSNPHSAIFGFTDVLDRNYFLVNHLLLIFKYNVYNARINNTLSFQNLKCVISQIKHIEGTIIENNLNKKRKISNKWKLIDHRFQSSRNFENVKIGAKLFCIVIIIAINSCYCYYYCYFYHKCYLEKEKVTGFTNSVYMFICMLFLY